MCLVVHRGSFCSLFSAHSAKGSMPHKGNLQRSENGENIPNASAKGLGASKPEGNRPKDSHIAGDINAQNQPIPVSLARPPSPFIFLTIEKDPRKKTCCTRPVAQGVSDKDAFTKLRSTYRTLRPGWLWEPIGIKFYRVQFNLIEDHCNHEYEANIKHFTV